MYLWGCTCSSSVLASGSQLGGLSSAGGAETSNTSYISPLTNLVLDCHGARLLQFQQSKAKVHLLAIAPSINFRFYISWKTKTTLYFFLYAHQSNTEAPEIFTEFLQRKDKVQIENKIHHLSIAVYQWCDFLVFVTVIDTLSNLSKNNSEASNSLSWPDVP